MPVGRWQSIYVRCGGDRANCSCIRSEAPELGSTRCGAGLVTEGEPEPVAEAGEEVDFAALLFFFSELLFITR